MKNLFFPLLFLSLLAGSAPAQKFLLGVNDQYPPKTTTGAKAWFAVEAQAPAAKPLPVLAVEFPCGPKQSPTEFAIFSKDPATGKPAKQLAYGKFNSVPARVWQGGTFSKVLLIKPGQKFFIGYKNVSGYLPIVNGGIRQIHYWNNSWSGPFTTQTWAYRLYGPGGNGTYASYGTGKSGSAGTAALKGLGWPNIGNPVGFLVSNVPDGFSGFLGLGRKIPGLPLGPLGRLYTFPVFTTFALPKASRNYTTAYLKIPNTIYLVGAPLSWQAWVMDPTAPGGLVHTQGVLLTVGN